MREWLRLRAQPLVVTARGTRDSDAHRSRAQKPAAIVVDSFGGIVRVHGSFLASIVVLGCTCVLPDSYDGEAGIARYAL